MKIETASLKYIPVVLLYHELMVAVLFGKLQVRKHTHKSFGSNCYLMMSVPHKM